MQLTDAANRPATSWSASGLPAGLAITATTGAITGTPTQSGTFTIALTATGPGGTSPAATAVISISAGTPIIPSGQTFPGKFGTAFSGAIALTDSANRPAAKWSATGLPAGLALNTTTGEITGTPTVAGVFILTVSVVGVNGSSASAKITITIVGAPIITSQSFTGKVGVAFSATPSLTEAANRPVTSWSATGLPIWATLNTATGKITGTPQDSGSTTITLTATGPGGTDTQSVIFAISFGAPIITAGQTFSGKVGTAFSATPALTDATDRPATNWSATGLPAGLTLNATTGAITGTPQDSGSTTISLTATGPGGVSSAMVAVISFSFGVPIITSGQTFNGKVGIAFSATPSITDATERPVESWSATGLPSWATLNTATGKITGTPQDSGNTTISLTATGPGGTDTQDVIFAISFGAPIITVGQIFSGKVGAAFSATPALTDAIDRPATNWSATGLPAGLTLNATTGAITGTPLDSGNKTITLTATGPGGVSSATVAVTSSFGAPIITVGQIFSGKVGAAFSATPALTDATDRPATNWSATGLPIWATLNTTTGKITGTPQDSGSTTITLTATGLGGTATQTASISVAVGAPILTASQSFTGKVGAAFSATIALTDSVDRPANSWNATGLTAGLALNTATGEITGTPLNREAKTATVTATGPGGVGEAVAVTFTIAAQYLAPIIVFGQSFTGKVGEAFTSPLPSLEDPQDRPASSWAITGLPAGLVFHAPSATITGTPTTKGSFTANFIAVGSGGTSAPSTVTFTIASGAPIITPAQTATGAVGAAFSFSPALSDSTNRPASNWSATSLPSGLELNALTGEITGTPQDRATAIVTLTATGAGGVGTATASLAIAAGTPIIRTGQTFTGKVGAAFSATPALTDAANRPAISWGTNGLPAGLEINATTGEVTGTPTKKGSFTNYIFAYGAENSGGSYETITLTITAGAPIIPSGQTFPSKIGAAFSATPSITDAVERPVSTWAATGLPSWATLNTTTGKITGTPQDSGNTTITLTATGPGGTSAATTASISVAFGAPFITAGQSFTGKVGDIFPSTRPSLTDALDRPATSWSATGLPAGLSLDATGLITGTPRTLGTITANFIAVGSGGTSAPSTVTFTIASGAPIITPAQTATGAVGAAFSFSPALSDSTNRPASNWSATSLPSGLELNATTGEITGTPQDRATTTVTLTASGTGGVGTATASLAIAAGTPIIQTGQTFTGKVGAAFSFTPAITDTLNRPATSWAASSLPTWATLNATTGAITGTPTKTGDAVVNLSAYGSGGTSAVTPVTFTVSTGVPLISAGQNGIGKVGVPFSKKYTASDTDNRPVTSWTSVSLPPWATLNSATGEVTGIPTTSGTSAISLTATGSGGTSSVAEFSLVLGNGAPIITPGQTLAGKVGVVFSATPALTDAANRPATSWSASGLPAGLAITATTGAITGTPTQSGEFSFSISALSVEGESVESVAFTIAFGSPQIIPGQKLSIVQTEPFSAQLQGADESERPISAWTSSDIPSWATLESDGRVHGTPPASGQFTFTVTATGPGGTDTDTVSLESSSEIPVIATTLVDAKVGVLHESYFTTTEPASMPVSFWGVTGALPAGLSLDPTTGRLFGTPQAVGTSAVSTYAQNSVGKGSATISIVVAPGVPIVSAQEFYGAAGKDFEATLQAQDTTNRPATTWSIAPALPSGLALAPATGKITGNLTNPVRFSATLTATGAGGTASAALTLDIGAPIIAPIDARVDFALDAVVAFTTATITSGRSKVETWSASSLPTGITFKDGVFLGRAQASGTYQITVTTQNKWDTATAKVTFVVAQGAPIIVAGQKFSAKTDSKAEFEVGLVNKSSRPATKWTAQGTLPRGLVLGQDGRISGTPSQNFTGTITLIAESLLGKSTASIGITIKGPIFYGDKNPVLQPGRVVKTFPSGLVMVSEVYKMRPSNEAAARSRFAQGQTLVTSSTSSTPLKIFPAPDFKSQDSGFVEMVVTAYGFTGADFRRTRKRMQSAKMLTKVLEAPAGGGAPTFQGKYSESNIQIFANTHTITRAVAYGTAVNPLDGAHGVTSPWGYTAVISPVTERYDVTAFGEVDEVTVTTAYKVTFTQQ